MRLKINSRFFRIFQDTGNPEVAVSADTKTLQRRRKYFGLKDMLDWSEMGVATTFF